MATRTYRAATMKEALERVRRDLGPAAVIVESRETRRRGLFGLLKSRELVELKATLDPRPEKVWRTPSLRVDAGESLPASAALHAQMGEQLGRLHEMVSQLTRQGRVEHLMPDLPAELATAYAELVEADVPDLFARRVVHLAADLLEPDEIEDPDVLRHSLVSVIADFLPIAPPTTLLPDSRILIALVGPTGVGKTTTVAKLAAAFKIGRGARVGLVTADTYRIAAVQQLRTYAEIIDVPLAVVDEPRELPTAIETLGPVDVILLDTAGRSPRDEQRMHQLAELLTVARPDEVHLVLSATAGPRTLQAAAERFAEARADRLILTKLDEADALGGLLELVSRVNLPISYLTTGQTVPDDLEAAERERLAGLIIGTLAISVTQPHAPTPARVPNATVRSAANRSVTPPARKL